MANGEITVPVSLERYDELMDIKTRVDVIVERIYHNEYLTMEDILWMLGTELAVEKAQELRESAGRERKEYKEQLNEREGCEPDE